MAAWFVRRLAMLTVMSEEPCTLIGDILLRSALGAERKGMMTAAFSRRCTILDAPCTRLRTRGGYKRGSSVLNLKFVILSALAEYFLLQPKAFWINVVRHR